MFLSSVHLKLTTLVSHHHNFETDSGDRQLRVIDADNLSRERH